MKFTPPAGFEQPNPRIQSWRRGTFTLRRVEVMGPGTHEDYIRTWTYHSLAPDSNHVHGSGNSQAGAGERLNARLEEIGIDHRYDLSGLSTEHDTQVDFLYMTAWVATHTCTPEELPILHQYLTRFRTEWDKSAAAQYEIDLLRSTQLQPKPEMPQERIFHLQRVPPLNLPELWFDGQLPLYEGGTLLISTKGGILSVPEAIVQADDSQDHFRKRVRANVNISDIILTDVSFQNAERRGENFILPVYRIFWIDGRKAHGRREFLHSSLLPVSVQKHLAEYHRNN